MATVQQLEKLYHVRRLFHVEDSLEAAVAGERVKLMIEKTEQLIRQRAFLREERRYLRTTAEALEEYKLGVNSLKSDKWIPNELKSLPSRCIQINVGGLMFEVSDYVLKRDSASLLSQLCDENPPVLKDPNGVFYFDRDWWLFRYILIFLRDGSLPQDRNLLAQLYREAAFWHLVELQKAIEEDKLHLRGKADEDSEKSSWWRKALSVPNVALSEKAEMKKKSETDWWTGTSYKGVQYLPLSSSPGKTTTKKGANDVLRVPENTWYAYQEQHRGW